VAHALVLNATYEPLCVVSARRAVVLVLAGKAAAVESSDTVLHSERSAVRVPVVVRLTRFVRVPYRGHVPLTRRAVFARDGGRCVYCAAPATSIDHVVPRSRGGEHVWDNVVSCCRRCNHAKADRHISELGWRMPPMPRAPTGPAWRVLGTGRMHPTWLAYLEPPLGEPASA
jgi:5-methylcytosine-specific restriction endonuclease McrA